ncbi:hypothetical protein PG993_009568 [Apiospora rasikravindrae]|uniref:Thioesterase family protein n=1 Tax=Apiospora rasikravindrae TaxID=990691 RepID=A0ABR1SJR9_9PEZI
MSVQQRPAAPSPPTFAAATAVQQLSTHTYHATFDASWVVGSVPHGGVVTSVLLRCAALHFSTTLAAQSQPHAITLHAEFLRRTQAGPATLRVRDVKLGRQTSTVHVTLSQPTTSSSSSDHSDSSSSSNAEREEVVAYITHTNLATESGPTFETGWQLEPPPPPPPSDFAALTRGSDEDAHWAEWTAKPFPEFRKVIQQMRIYLPRGGRQATDSLCDEWIHFADPAQRFTDTSLGLVSDLWPQVIESLVAARQNDSSPSFPDGSKRQPLAKFWYPTLLLNLDIKKALPAEGVEWLFVRVRAKQIRNGRQDLEVVILDQQGEIVALSHHVALVLDAKRNTAKRRSPSSKI